MSTDNKFQFLLEKIRRNKGVDFSLYREGTLRRRIDSRLRTTGCADYLEYISYLNRNPEEYDRLIEAVTINVTEFFRNPETFHVIQKKVLPEIIKNKLGLQTLRPCSGQAVAGLVEAGPGGRRPRPARARPGLQPRKTIRAWCAGTSYGEETYSIAILLLQVLQERIADYNIKVFGTDIDPACIARAKTGIYEPSHLKEVNKNILNKYFHREGENFRVKDEVKQLTEFKLHDLTHWNFPPKADPWPSLGRPPSVDKEAPRISRMARIKTQNRLQYQCNPCNQWLDLKNIDLILCRNVVIYFTKPLQELVYGLFLKSLNKGGFLVLGKVESLGGYPQRFFEAVDNKERIYRKG